jgi:hypothetical protein
MVFFMALSSVRVVVMFRRNGTVVRRDVCADSGRGIPEDRLGRRRMNKGRHAKRPVPQQALPTIFRE